MATTTLIATVLQGSADAFAIATLNTGLSGLDNNAYKVVGMLAEMPPLAVAANCEREFGLGRATKAAMPTIADDDLLFKYKDRALVQTSGIAIYPMVAEITPEDEIIVIESQLYVYFDTAATTAVNTLILRVYVEPVKVTTDQRIAILQSRIN